MIHPYNDRGLLARDKLIVLAEAQSTWSVNIIFRLADYYFDSAMSYLKIRKADLHLLFVQPQCFSSNSPFFWTNSICCQHERKMYFFRILPE